MAFRVLIIGGTGQVGAAVVRALVAEPSCAEVVMVNRKAIPLTANYRLRQVILDTADAQFPAEVTKLALSMVALGDPADKELGLAVKLIEALNAKFEPEKFRDKYREQVEALIAAKIQGRELASGRAEPADAAPLPDIMDALKKSLAAARKPPARAEEVTAESKPERRAKRQAKKR